jgi:hypothetical protein
MGSVRSRSIILISCILAIAFFARCGKELPSPAKDSASQVQFELSKPQPKWSLDKLAVRSIPFGKDKEYLAVLLETHLIQVYDSREDHRKLVWYFEEFNRLACAPKDFHLEDLNGDGTEEIMYRGCKSHFCTEESLAIIYDAANKQLLRLDWNSDKGGLQLSDDALAPRNRSMKNWLLDWWSEWPGSKEAVEKRGLKK